MLPSIAACALAGCGPGAAPGAPHGAPAAQPRNVVLVSVDTLRADFLGCYGRAGARTETLDQIAAEGVLFDAAISPTPITLPAHATLLTGLNPWRLGIRHNGLYRLEPGFETLAERLAGRGLRTAAIIAGYPLIRASGLDQGFATYDDAVDTRGDEIYEMPFRRAESVIDAAIGWLKTESSQPFLLFVHLYDPHDPYEPPAGYIRPDADGIAAYEGEIAYVDDQLQRLIATLEQLGRQDDTLLIVTADHGEGLMTHGELTHGVFLYEETIRVPLLMRAPQALPAGRRVAAVTGLVDVVSTICEALGVPAPERTDGKSIWGLAAGGPAPDREAVFSESYFGRIEFGWAPIAAARTQAFKLISAPQRELYHLEQDPGERRNLTDQNDLLADRLEQLLNDARREEAPDLPLAVSEEELERLRSLGYFQGAKRPGRAAEATAAAGEELPDPKDRIRRQAELQIASFELSQGRTESAEARLTALVNGDPLNITARCRLADARSALGNTASAERVLRETLTMGDAATTSPALWRLAGLARRQGHHDQALALYRRYATAVPPTERVARAIAKTLEAAGRPTEAQQVLTRWQERGQIE